MTKTKLIGAHVSSAGGLDKAVERASAITANCMQVFSGSPRTWKRSSLADLDPSKLFAKEKELSVSPVFTHALYLINLTADKPDLKAKSIAALKYDLEFDSRIKGKGVIVHLGSHLGRGWEAVRDELVETLKQILDQTPEDSHLLIENSAGQKGKLTSRLEEIKWLMDQVKNKRLQWCFDTCHAYAAGYKLGDPDKIADQTKSAIAEISHHQLWSSLACIHVNDSRDDFDSGRDRHANIGDGNIPSQDLKYFLNYPKLESVPLITEVPGLDNQGPDLANIQRIRDLV